eukprot:Skav202162  [mRNA]  locus=scaffold970:353126:358553:- [translate_table: standard]
MLVAQAVILRNHVQEAVIRPDLHLSIHIAQETCSVASNTTLAQLLRAQQSWLPKTTMVPVEGHSGDPWNELADALARWAVHSRGPLGSFADPILHELAGLDVDRRWLWFQHAPDSLKACLPPLHKGQFMQFTPNAEVLHLPDEQPSQESHPLLSVECSVVTANVLALDLRNDVEVGRNTAVRTSRLDQQWHAAGFAIAGLQETRTAAGCYQSPHYAIYAYGCDHTSTRALGCEIWIHKSIPVAWLPHGEALTWDKATIVTVATDPRRLVLHLQWPAFRCFVASFHAPYVGAAHTHLEVQQWWADTEQLLAQFNEACTIVCVDANAAIQEEIPNVTGDVAVEEANHATPFFVEALQQACYWIPSTFSHCHSGSSWTWTHPRGHRKRRDYLLLPCHLRTWEVHTWTLQDHDTTFAHEDRIPVAMTLRGSLSVPAAASSSTVLKWNHEALRDPNLCLQFRHALESLPLPTWKVVPDSHCQLWEKQVLQLGQQFFAAAPRKPKKLKLPETALNLIAFKRQVLDFGRRHSLMHTAEFKSELKHLEALIQPRVQEAHRQFYHDLLQQATGQGGHLDTKELFATLLRLGRRRSTQGSGPKPLPVLRAPDGQIVKDFEAQQKLWFQQFQANEAGFQVPWDCIRALNGDGPTFPEDWQLYMDGCSFATMSFIHFFSGYRRTQDIHSILDQYNLPDSSQLITLSIDLCMQRESGDLAQPHALRWWQDRAASGQILGCGGGPPCETYTAARCQHDLDPHDSGPRPLRTREFEAGVPALASWEWDQIHIGTRLMHFLQVMLTMMIRIGGCGFLEHPQWPTWLQPKDHASVWGTRPMRLLRSIQCVAITSFDQCIFGSLGRKPTTILTVRLPSFRHRVMRSGWGGRCPHPKNFHQALKGRNDQGAFRTASHKIYPAGLNQALAEAIRIFFEGLAAGDQHSAALPEAFSPFLEQTFATTDIVQPDFYQFAGR